MTAKLSDKPKVSANNKKVIYSLGIYSKQNTDALIKRWSKSLDKIREWEEKNEQNR